MFLKKLRKFIDSGEQGLQWMITTPQWPNTLKQRNEELNTKSKSSTPEADPHGKQQHEPGAKLDAGKICVYRGAIGYFPKAIEQVAAVSTFGARKYAWKGWEDVPDGVNRYSDAMGRHLIEEGQGHTIDRDSGLLVAAHTAWNALARLELMLREEAQTTMFEECTFNG